MPGPVEARPLSPKLTPLVREVLADELRRLTGRRRRPLRRVPEAVPLEPAVEKVEDEWAAQVLAHAERTMARGPAHTVPARSDPRASAFELLDIGLVPDAVAHVVRARPGIAEKDLVGLVAAELMVSPLPANYQRLLGRLVWSARGRRLIELTDGVWAPGSATDGVIPELEGRTLDGLAALAGELKEHDTTEAAIFHAVMEELVGTDERVPRIVAVVVGVAIGLARRRGDLDYDRWGQASLGINTDG